MCHTAPAPHLYPLLSTQPYTCQRSAQHLCIWLASCQLLSEGMTQLVDGQAQVHRQSKEGLGHPRKQYQCANQWNSIAIGSISSNFTQHVPTTSHTTKSYSSDSSFVLQKQRFILPASIKHFNSFLPQQWLYPVQASTGHQQATTSKHPHQRNKDYWINYRLTSPAAITVVLCIAVQIISICSSELIQGSRRWD